MAIRKGSRSLPTDRFTDNSSVSAWGEMPRTQDSGARTKPQLLCKQHRKKHQSRTSRNLQYPHRPAQVLSVACEQKSHRAAHAGQSGDDHEHSQKGHDYNAPGWGNGGPPEALECLRRNSSPAQTCAAPPGVR